MYGSNTRFDTTTARPGNRLTCVFTLVNVSSGNLDWAAFMAAQKPTLVNLYRTQPAMEELRRMQVEVHFRFSDKSGKELGTIIVSPKDI